MGRAEPFIWGFAIVFGILLFLFALAISAKALRELFRGTPPDRQVNNHIAGDYEAAADELRDLIARSYGHGQSRPKND